MCWLPRLQQERVIKKQQAREKLRRLVAPLLQHHDPSTLALRAFGHIRPKLSVSFEQMHVRLRNGTTILEVKYKHCPCLRSLEDFWKAKPPSNCFLPGIPIWCSCLHVY